MDSWGKRKTFSIYLSARVGGGKMDARKLTSVNVIHTVLQVLISYVLLSMLLIACCGNLTSLAVHSGKGYVSSRIVSLFIGLVSLLMPNRLRLVSNFVEN